MNLLLGLGILFLSFCFQNMMIIIVVIQFE